MHLSSLKIGISGALVALAVGIFTLLNAPREYHGEVSLSLMLVFSALLVLAVTLFIFGMILVWRATNTARRPHKHKSVSWEVTGFILIILSCLITIMFIGYGAALYGGPPMTLFISIGALITIAYTIEKWVQLKRPSRNTRD
ncbi:MAG: hypothetical protein LBB58_01350 [Cellulomonadaceae bacterium]|jgi:uncharacterized membrane protein YidH (DUF202 family)|nr:hypothetical protein [Cellulomonadaceae bacterium]